MKVLGFVIALALASPVVGQALAVPVPAKSFQPMGSVKLSKVVVNIRRGDRIGYEKSSGICLIPHEVLWRTGQVEIEDRDLEGIFREQVKRAGFRTPGGVDELFESNEDDSVDLLVGASVNRIDMNVCYPRTEDLEKSRGTASIDVEWQIYSQLERRVIGRLKITGVANRREAVGGGRFGLVKDAFADAVRQLVQGPQFTDVIAKPRADLSLARSAPVALVALTIENDARPTRSLTEVVSSTALVFAGGGHGSGVLISADGYVLTNHHVVGSASYVKVRWSDRSEVLGEVVRTDAARDVALIKTDARGRRPLPLRGTPVAVGEEIYAVGAPADQQFQGTVTRGIVSAKRVFEGFNFIQSDVGVTHGNSGGPIVDAKGQVVGLTDIGFEGAPMLNLFIPIDEALSFLGLQIAPASLPAPASIRPKR